MGRMIRKLLGACVGVLFLCNMALAQGSARYEPASEVEEGHAAIVWVATVATNLFYIPTKFVYAGLGGFVGGLGWILTGADTEAADGIWGPTVRGNWVVTPSMLEGKEEVRFVGP